MNIQNNDLTIRNATESDCEQLAAWWNDGKVMEHAGFPNGLGTNAGEFYLILYYGFRWNDKPEYVGEQRKKKWGQLKITEIW